MPNYVVQDEADRVVASVEADNMSAFGCWVFYNGELPNEEGWGKVTTVAAISPKAGWKVTSG